MAHEPRHDGVGNEGGFSGPRDPGDGRHHPKRNLRREVLQVVRSGVFHREPRGVGAGGSVFARADVARKLSRKVLPRDGVARFDFARRSVKDDGAALRSGGGPHVDDAISGQHHLRIVLHDDERVSGRFQVRHDGVDAVHVARVQADRGFVQNEEGVNEVRAQRGREVDALHFAARKRPALPIEREVAQAHVNEIDKASPDFREDHLPRVIRHFGVQRVDEGLEPRNRQQHQVVEREAGQFRLDAGGDAQEGRACEALEGGAVDGGLGGGAASHTPVHGVGL